MPDLTYHNARWCLSNESDQRKFEGSNGETWTADLSRQNPGPYGVNWACDCPGYRFRGNCKHVKIAEEEACGYGWGAACGNPEPDEVWEGPEHTCPKCGGPSRVMSFAA